MDVGRVHAPLHDRATPSGRDSLPDRLDVGQLALLTEVTQQLEGPLGDEAALDAVLKTLETDRSFVRACLFIVDRGQNQLVLERAPSIPQARRRRGRYALGEGVIGEVASKGEVRAIEKLEEAPAFLDRLGLRGGDDWNQQGFIAVPVKYGEELVGVLTCDRLPASSRAIENDVSLLKITARIIAPSAAARQAKIGKGTNDDATARILGRSKATRSVTEAVRTVGPSDSTVLILGESGTGKELVADAIHRSSPRSAGPFVKVNCAALPEGILESELFGHEAGAFTGAMRQRIGRFESASGGTIFLDEIGDLPASTQVALLRTLQERTLQRVGGNADIEVNVRVIAATHRDLVSAIANGEFRQDLYYRLDVFPIRVPSLRDRRTDIPLLADHFVDRYAKAARKRVRRISSRAIDMLMAYHWPGNVRELENCIERAVLLCEDQVIHGRHLPPTLQMDEPQNSTKRGTLEATLDAIERDMLDDALKLAKGNMAEAARQLGLTERKMGLRVKRHALDPRKHRRNR